CEVRLHRLCRHFSPAHGGATPSRLGEELRRHTAAEEATARRERHGLAGLAASPLRKAELLEPCQRRRVDGLVESPQRERLVQTQAQEDALTPLDGRRQRFQLAWRHLATTER